MRSLIIAAGLGATLVLSAPVSRLQDVASIFERQSSCASVYVLVARASTESQGEGVLATLASDITSQISGSVSAAVTYPASLTDYRPSEQSGVAAATQEVTSYVQSCPDTKIVLLGYSQVLNQYPLFSLDPR